MSVVRDRARKRRAREEYRVKTDLARHKSVKQAFTKAAAQREGLAKEKDQIERIEASKGRRSKFLMRHER